MKKISLVINTLNEEACIENCINSARLIADEIIICDMYSDDKTVMIAQKLGAQVIMHKRTGYVEPARYFAISHATHEWVLVLDADEILTPELGYQLQRIVQSDSADLVTFAFLYNYFGRYIKHGGFFLESLPRMFKKERYIDTYSHTDELVHRNFISLMKNTQRIIKLPKEYYIIHEAYPTFEKYLKKTLCNYALIDSRGLFDSGKKVTFLKVIGAPIKEFIIRYFIKQGFREGKIGFILCYLKSQYTFYTCLNLWFLIEDEKKKEK